MLAKDDPTKISWKTEEESDLCSLECNGMEWEEGKFEFESLKLFTSVCQSLYVDRPTSTNQNFKLHFETGQTDDFKEQQQQHPSFVERSTVVFESVAITLSPFFSSKHHHGR
jgi:hypothetical protein